MTKNHTNKEKNIEISGSYFLAFKNKYGEAHVNKWLSKYNYTQRLVSEMLSSSNKCISEKNKDATIIKLFIRQLVDVCSDIDDLESYRFYDCGIKKIGYLKYDNDVTKLFIKCYNEASLEPLLKDDEKSPFTIEQLEQTALNASHLFVLDRTGELENAVLDRLWTKLYNEAETPNPLYSESRAYLYLLSGNKVKAEQVAKAAVAANPNSFNSLCNYCISLYLSGKKTEMDEELVKFRNSNQYNKDSVDLYFDILSSKILRMTELGILEKDNNLLLHIVSIFKWDIIKNEWDYIKNGLQRVAKEVSGVALNTMSYEFAEASQYSLAIMCINKAIRLYPEEANYYDSKGEILLMQGDLQNALDMWNKVIAIDPNFLDSYNSKLHRQLLERGLLSENLDNF